MEKCEKFCYFFPIQDVPSGVILQPKIYREIELFFFFNGEEREDTVNHKEATRMR